MQDCCQKGSLDEASTQVETLPPSQRAVGSERNPATREQLDDAIAAQQTRAYKQSNAGWIAGNRKADTVAETVRPEEQLRLNPTRRATQEPPFAAS